MSKLIFPKNFYWGASTSAYQVEGGNNNDWSVWELKTKRKEVSGWAVDHYNRYEEDFEIAKSLNHNAHRFSIEWSRIEPEEGKFNEKEIEHYRSVIQSLRTRNIEPFVTLWHWTNPLWLANLGGVENKKFIFFFKRYAEVIAKNFGDSVNFWITINEPEIYAAKSYLTGDWPPQKRNPILYCKTIKNLIRAHKKIYKSIKNINPAAQIGIAKNNVYFEAYKNKFLNRGLKKIADWWWNFHILNKIKNRQDFIGLNYYFHNRVKDLKFKRNENKKVSDMGWEIYPEGIYRVLKDLKKYNKPVYITENGVADAKDNLRKDFIKDHLIWIHKAISEGIDVRGYLHWSLFDNFEWDKGFWPRFGLVEIDYKTMERKIRKSAEFYAEIAKNNYLET